MVHHNINVFNLQASLNFYELALGLKETSRMDDVNFTIVYLSDQVSGHLLELTYLKDRSCAYDLGDNEVHFAFIVDDYEQAKKFHGEQGWICFDNDSMGIYFIEDPDGYWIEILPAKR